MAESKGLFEIVKATRKATRKTRKAAETVAVSEDAKARFALFIRAMDGALDAGKGAKVLYRDGQGRQTMPETDARRIIANMKRSGVFGGLALVLRGAGEKCNILGYFKRTRPVADGTSY